MTIESVERSIPVPPGFPVQWERPEDATRFWERELMHVPMQATVLDDAFMQLWIEGGFNAACEAYSMPVRNRYLRINTYEYQSIAPVGHDPAELHELGEEAERRLGAALGGQLARWENERLPEIKRALADWEAFDRQAASDEAFARHLEETVDRSVAAWRIHYLTVFPVVVAMSLFDDLYRELFAGTGALEPFRLLQGFENHSTEADRALFEVAERARASAAIRDALERGDSFRARDDLEQTPEGRAFVADLRAYLDRYGRRQDGYISISQPSWLEDPAPVMAAIRDHVFQAPRDLGTELTELARERELLVASDRERLAGVPEEVAGKFEFLLAAAQEASVMQENHNFWIDGQVVFSVRRVVREAGRRLAERGALDREDDVFHLTLEELREAVAARAGELRSAVAARREELARFAAVQAPPVLGSFPPGPPPDDPISRAIFKMFGVPQEPPAEPTTFTGMAGSPGLVRGTARILRSLADADRLRPGEILVAPTTSPPWTPLFATAAAIVTDVGGVLSHCAIVAREYMIPAVVGTKVATSLVRDGQELEVNGDEGIVRVLGG
jgi:pyruvate,water dikinase